MVEHPIIEACKGAESPAMIQAICFAGLINAIESMQKKTAKEMSAEYVAAVDTFTMVQGFNEKFGLAYAGQPRMLPPALRRLKEVHLHEELVEYKKALEKGNLEGCLDALIDLVYVALGAAYLHGFDFNEGFRRVHAANMRKERARIKEDSKRNSEYDIIKPAGWEPANLEDLC